MTGPNASRGRTRPATAEKQPVPISAVMLKNMLSCSPGPPGLCHGCADTSAPGAAPIAPATASSRPSFGWTSASRNNRISPVETFTPCAHACGLPSQPAGGSAGRSTRAPDASATSEVASVDRSSTTINSSTADSWLRIGAKRAGSDGASLRAGTITEIDGRSCNRPGGALSGLGRASRNHPRPQPSRNGTHWAQFPTTSLTEAMFTHPSR